MVQTLLVYLFLAIINYEIYAIEVSTFECGTTNFTRALISKGAKTDRGEWPFLTALHYVEEFKFFCGGSLISDRHVLTGTVELNIFDTEITTTKN